MANHRFTRCQALAAAAVFLCSADLVQDVSHEAVVRTSFGKIQGNLLEDSVEYLGIPYAMKPERFLEAKPWDQPYDGGSLNATVYTPWCIQDGPPSRFAKSGFSEDCLHLNIYTPRRARRNITGSEGRQDETTSLLPVMIWIHGGSLLKQSAMSALYNASNMAGQRDVVVVAINYRLGVMGFAAFGGGNSSAPLAANNGFRDQREAMRWVQNHIAAFGGDKNSVTIFGESAGGQSVTYHVLSEGSSGLFHRAISQSGDTVGTIELLEDALKHSESLAMAVGCASATDMSCLQQATAANLTKAYTALGADPAVVDGDILEAAPLDLIRQGKFNRVPFIVGNNQDEGSLFVFPYLPEAATAENVRCALSHMLGDEDAQKVIETYPLTDGIDNRPVLVEFLSDFAWRCGNMDVVQALAERGSSDLWMYSFKHRLSGSPSPIPPLPVPGAYHSIEVPFVFNNLHAFSMMGDGSTKPTLSERSLAAQVSSLWANFARTGQPDAADRWPRYSLDGHIEEAVLKIDTLTLTPHAKKFDFETGYRRSQCAVFDAIMTRNSSKIYKTVQSYIRSLPACFKKKEERRLLLV